jgi:hypothetical protein
MILFAMMMALSFPYSASASESVSELVMVTPCSTATGGLLIHWNFDNNLTNTGMTGGCNSLTLSPPYSYSPGVDLKTSGALNFTYNDIGNLSSVMSSIGTLNLAATTVSFYLKQDGIWNHYVFLASDVSNTYTFMIDDQIILDSTRLPIENPIVKLKSMILNSIWTIGDGSNAATSSFDGSIDEFRIYDSELTVDQLKTIDFSLANQVNTDHSSKITIDEVVNFLSTHNSTDHSSIHQLLDLITPIVEPLGKPSGL